MIDARTYPARGVEEPEDDKVLRGAHDGFVETLIFNTALIRRRIRDPQLTMEYLQVGSTSKTDLVLCYMDERVNHKQLRDLRDKLKGIDIPSLTMGQESPGGMPAAPPVVQPLSEGTVYRAPGLRERQCGGGEDSADRG